MAQNTEAVTNLIEWFDSLFFRFLILPGNCGEIIEKALRRPQACKYCRPSQSEIGDELTIPTMLT